jgi:hypothetical protein
MRLLVKLQMLCRFAGVFPDFAPKVVGFPQGFSLDYKVITESL